jgi:hypothetical protein
MILAAGTLTKLSHTTTTAIQSLTGIMGIRGTVAQQSWEAGARRLLQRMQWPLAIMALLVVPALILEERATSPAVRQLCEIVNWFVWFAFVAEFCIGFGVARSSRTFLRSSWLNLAIILLSPPFMVPDALQAVRGLRAFRILRLFRLVRAFAFATIGLRNARAVLASQGFPYVLLVTAAAIGLGALERFSQRCSHAIATVTDVVCALVCREERQGDADQVAYLVKCAGTRRA